MNDGVESGPVLWRLVRSVLNPTRLRMLRLICETDGTLCVREIPILPILNNWKWN